MRGWSMAGSHPREYEHGILEGEDFEGDRVGFLRCREGRPSGFGTMMQMFAADDYLGRRIELRGWLRTIGVEGWAGMWMRIDGSHDRHTAFDNMENRSLTGSTPWAPHHVVLDVADESVAIAFGVLLRGKGEVHVARLGLGEVGREVDVTSSSGSSWQPLPPHPVNLTFADD